MILRSLSFRLALSYAALFAGSMLLLLACVYWLTIARPYEQMQAQVSAEMDGLAAQYILEGEPALTRALGVRAAQDERVKAYHLFRTPAGKILTNLPARPRAIPPGWLRIEADIYVDGDEEDHEALLLGKRFRDGATLLVGRDIVRLTERGELLRSLAAYVLGISLLLGLAGGLLMSRAIGRRIDLVARTARSVMEGDLSGRVPLQGSGDDFDRLGQTLNAMLARIEALFESVRRVSDNIAHELRTPLARLRSHLEQNAGPEAVEAAIEEVDRLQALFSALLRIAHIESGRHVLNAAPLALEKLLADAADYYEPEAEARGIRLILSGSGGCDVAGDASLLFQAILNLLDNAVKFSPAGATIRLACEAAGGRTTLTVADRGPGISEADRARVFERFFRTAEAAGFTGTGLGLPLVAAIAKAHGSTIVLEPNNPGLIVRWSFPRPPRS